MVDEKNIKGFTMLGVLVLVVVGGGVIVDDAGDIALLDVCVEHQEEYYGREQVLVGNYTDRNGTTRESYDWVDVLMVRNVSVCEQNIIYQGDLIPVEEKGFSCADSQAHITCDSIRDGNGDGVCQLGGGETCCIINKNSGVVLCKNGDEEIPPNRNDLLGVRQ